MVRITIINSLMNHKSIFGENFREIHLMVLVETGWNF